jgi:hypothetical protein
MLRLGLQQVKSHDIAIRHHCFTASDALWSSEFAEDRSSWSGHKNEPRLFTPTARKLPF